MSEVEVERVARAICEAFGDDWEDKPEKAPPGTQAYSSDVPDRSDFRQMARAAIAAMQEPK
jgi:hypothetical protein